LEAFEKSDPPVRYIVGVRMRRQKEVNTSVLGSRADWFESVPERGNAKDPAPLKPIFYSERHSFLGRSRPGAAWRAIEVLVSQKCSAISLA